MTTSEALPAIARAARAVRSGAFAIIAIFLLYAGPSGAQTFQFDSVSIEGNQRIEDATILSLAELPLGQPLSPGQVNDALQRTLASGLFEEVSFDPRGRTLNITVQEWPTISRINVEGNRRLDDAELTALLASQPRRVFNPRIAEQDAARIVDAYEARGRFAANVTPAIIRRDDNRVDLVFEVVEGNVVEIERVSFVGNTAYSDRRLRRVLATKQAGALRGLVGQDTFISERLEFDRQLLNDFYQSRGYADFQVLDVTSEFSRERNATFITISVREGPQYRFGRIGLASTLPEVNEEDFQRAVRVRSGQTYSPLAVQNTIDRLERQALDERLDFVRAEPVITRNPRDLTIDVNFQLVRAPRVFVERIDIEGNQTTLDRVIRRQFGTVEGDPFNPREIQRSADRIRALGFFESATVETRPGSAPDQVIVDVDVVEQPTGSLSFGGSFSVDSGFGVAIGFAERNFLGRGQTLAFDLQAGTQNQDSSLRFIEPAFLGRDVAFQFEAFFRETDFDNTFFDTRQIGIRPALAFPLNDATRLNVYYLLSLDDVRNVDEDTSPIIQREEGELLTSAVGYRLSYDTRRTGLNPSAGVLVSFGQEFAGLGGDNQYIRSTLRAIAQQDILGEEVTIRAVFNGGALNFLDGGSRVVDRFFSSSGELRGFESRGVGPRDLDAGNTDVLGGNFYSVLSLEADFPLGLPEEYGISGGVFFNAGSVWGLDDTDGAGGPGSVDDGFELRTAIGFSIFWDTPLGPLRLDFAQPLESNPFDEEQQFNFSISTTF